MLKAWFKEWGFVAYFICLLAVFSFVGGGLNSKSHVLLALSGIFFLMTCCGVRRLGSVWGDADVFGFLAKKGEKGRWALMNWLLFFLMGFVVLSLASYFLSGVGNVGLYEMIAMVGGVVLFLVSVMRFDSEKILVWLMRLMVWLGIGAVVAGFGFYIFYPFNRFAGIFLDVGSFNGFYPNAWVDYLLFVMPAAGYLLSREGRDRWVGLVAMMLFGGSLILTYSRGGWLSFAVGLVVIVGLGMMFFWKSFKENFLQIVVGGVMVVLVSGMLAGGANYWRGSNSFDVEMIGEKAALQGDEESTSVNERMEFFKGGLKMMEEMPILGYGPYSFKYVFPRYQKEILALSDHAHNVFLKYGGERGVGALAFFVMFLVVVGLMAWRGMSAVMGEKKMVLLMTVGAMAGVLAHNMIDYNLNFLVNHLAFWVYLAVIVGVGGDVVESKDVKKILGAKIMGIIGVILVGGMFLVGAHEARYGLSLAKARSLENGPFAEEDDMAGEIAIVNERIILYEEAMQLWQKRDVPARLAKDYLRVGNLFEVENLAADMTERYPIYAELWYLWGEALRLQGRDDEAMQKYLKAIGLDPVNELRYYEGLYLVALKKGGLAKDEWAVRIGKILEEYLAKLKTNSHYTVLTGNPNSAAVLYELLGNKKRAREVRDLFGLEVDKLKRPRVYFGR